MNCCLDRTKNLKKNQMDESGMDALASQKWMMYWTISIWNNNITPHIVMRLNAKTAVSIGLYITEMSGNNLKKNLILKTKAKVLFKIELFKSLFLYYFAIEWILINSVSCFSICNRFSLFFELSLIVCKMPFKSSVNESAKI